jgi:hypothetical protein
MKRIWIIELVAGAVVMGMIVAANASAALPEFSATTGFEAIATAPAPFFEYESLEKITCQEAETNNANTMGGEKAEFNANSKLVTGFVITFKKCTSKGGASCTNGTNAGEIITEKMEAELGYLPKGKKGATSAALALKPKGGGALIAKYTCTKVNEIRGCIVGKIEPTNTPLKRFTLAFEESAGAVQKYKGYEKTEGVGETPCTATIEIGGGTPSKLALGSSQQVRACPNMEEIKA